MANLPKDVSIKGDKMGSRIYTLCPKVQLKVEYFSWKSISGYILPNVWYTTGIWTCHYQDVIRLNLYHFFLYNTISKRSSRVKFVLNNGLLEWETREAGNWFLCALLNVALPSHHYQTPLQNPDTMKASNLHFSTNYKADTQSCQGCEMGAVTSSSVNANRVKHSHAEDAPLSRRSRGEAGRGIYLSRQM